MLKMHELAITKEIVSIVLDACKKHKKTALIVRVQLGNLTTYKSGPLHYYYNLLKLEHEMIKESVLDVIETEGPELIIGEIECAKNADAKR